MNLSEGKRTFIDSSSVKQTRKRKAIDKLKKQLEVEEDSEKSIESDEEFEVVVRKKKKTGAVVVVDDDGCWRRVVFSRRSNH